MGGLTGHGDGARFQQDAHLWLHKARDRLREPLIRIGFESG